MRICVLNWRDLAHPAAGGAEIFTEQVLRRWAPAGHDITLVAAAVPGRPAEERVDGYQVVRRGGRLSVYREARRWWQRNGRDRFDVVIDEINTVPFQAPRWVDDGVPVLALVHQTCEDIWPYMLPRPAAALGRRVLEPHWLRQYATRPVMAVSASTRDALARFGVRDVTVVPEGFQPPAVLPRVAKETRPTVVFCGRMVEYKRPWDVLRAVQRAQREIPELQAWLIGDGPLAPRLRAAAPAGVHVLGRLDEARKLELMARAHVHLACSVREGWGLVVTEAAAVGTPTIAYDVPGLRDSTRAADGVVVPPDPDALARWLVDLLPRWQDRPPLALPHGGARSWDAVADAVWQVVEDRVQRARATGPAAETRPVASGVRCAA
jgi:glycosyltransferase involved in cell wall biosynthesis